MMSILLVQSFLTLRNSASSVNAPNSYEMDIRSNMRPSGEHVRRYNGPQTSESTAIIPGAGGGIIMCEDIVIHRRFDFNENCAEFFLILPVTH